MRDDPSTLTASVAGDRPTANGAGHALTASQRALWSSQLRHPNSPLQNMALLTHIAGEIDHERLRLAFDQVVAGSNTLRLTINGAGRATVADRPPRQTEVIEGSRRDLAAWAARRVSEPIDASEAVYDSVLIAHDDGTTSWYLCLHHVATDATSSALVFQATAAAYVGEPVELLDLDAAAAPSGKRQQRAIEFWTERCPAPLVESLYRPIDERTTANQRLAVDIDVDALEASLDGPYRMISRDLGWSALLMTALSVHLHRVSGAERFAVGLPVHNRSGRSRQRVVGPLMEVYPVDVTIEPEMTFADLHSRISRQLLSVVGQAFPDVGASAADVSAIVNVIPRGSMGAFGPFSTSTEWIHPGAADPHHLLGVQLTTYRSGRPEVSLDVNEAGASAAHRRSATGHLATILGAMVADPDQALTRVPLASDDELTATLAWGRGTPLALQRFDFEPGHPRTTGSVIDRLSVALANGSRPVLVDGTVTLTGRELWKRSGSVAANLVAAQIGRGHRVGVEMARSADAVVAILGVLRAGASYVPIDPNLPEDRRRKIDEWAGLSGVLTDLEGVDASLDAVDPRSVQADDEAYVLFTSGSTGQPKGVPISHGGLADYLAFASQEYLGPHQRRPVAPLFTSLGFDLTVTSLFLPLIAGGTVVVVADDGVPGLRQVAARRDLTWIKATPSHLELLARLLPERHRITTMVVGGEAFPARLAHQLSAGRPGLDIFNEYGPTEAVVGCMIHRFDPNTSPHGDVPIGGPAPGVTLRIVDGAGNDVPPGVPGELLISSDGLSTGYLGQPVDTPPFGRDGAARWYHSGDVVRLAPDGAVYLGRADDQIKLNGIRIEPAEIVAALESHPQVERAVVRSWQADDDARPLLAAWVETVDADVDAASLRSFLMSRLASHQIPAALSVGGALPFTSNGKLDTTQLPDPQRIHADGGEGVEALATPLAETISDAWRRALRLDESHPLGPHDDFFVLGGDSLAALEMVAGLSDSTGLDVSDGLPFAASVLGDFVAAVAVLDPDGARTAGPEPGVGGLGLSPGEEAMLFEHRLAPESPRYNIGRRYLVDGAIDHGRLQRAAEQVVQRHAPLRTTFGSERRVLSAASALDVSIADAGRELDEARSQAEAQSLYREPFDLEHGPLVRVGLHRLEPTPEGTPRSAIVIVCHHISGDAGSLDRLWADLDAAYSGVELEPLTVSYADHASWQRERDRGSEFWRAMWDTPATSGLGLPGSSGAHEGGYVERPASFTASSLRNAPGRTPTTTAVAVVAKLLDRHHRTVERPARYAIGLTASTREHRSADPMVGYFLNTLPLVLEVPSVETPVTALAEHAASVLGAALPHRSHPFAAMVAEARREGRPLPTPDVLLAVEDLAPASLDGQTAEHEVLASGEAIAPVTLFLQLRGERVDLGVEFDGSVMSRDRARLLLDDFDALLAQAVAGEVPEALLPSEQSGRIEGLAVADDTPLVSDLVGNIERRGEDAAVRCGGHELSWRALGLRSALLAEQLRLNGVGVGDRVIVSLPRSVDLVVAVMAVVRAGAVYVPLDPTYPLERRNRILRSAQAVAAVVEPGGEVAWTPSVHVPTSQHAESAVADRGALVADHDALVGAEDPAYVIFTSGSTGEPKGVEVSHRRLATSTRARDQVYGAGPERFLLLSSIGFDSSIVGLFWTLLAGGTIVIPTETEAHDPDALLGLIEQQRVSHVLMVPTLYRAILTRGAVAAHWPEVVTVAGEACPGELARRHHELRPDSELWNEYGPTEGTVWATVHRCHPDDDPVPIGTPIPGAWCAVVDSSLSPVPVGAAGELLIGGAGVVDGYLPDGLSPPREVAFVDHVRWSRSYRTGDQVAMSTNVEGELTLQFLGRVDDQLNVGGVRLEPGEVERVLSAVEGVEAVAVVANQVGDRLVVAAHVESSDVVVSRLRAAAAEALPAPARPARYVVHEALPTTVHGKVDRAALAILELPDDEPAVDSVGAGPAPADELQTGVLELFRRHTRREVDLDSRFFESGGDSLSALTLAMDLEDRFGRPFSVTSLLAEPTARAVASELRSTMSPTEPAEGLETPGAGKATTNLVEWIRSGESGRPVVVLLAPGSGHLLGYEPLIRALDPATPLLGVRLPGYDGKAEPVASVPDLAAIIAPVLRKALDARAEGLGPAPVVLLGGSSGGLLAWELHDQAESTGGGYDGLIMQDTVHPEWRRMQAATTMLEQVQQLHRRGGVGAVVGEFYGRAERRFRRWQRSRRSNAQAARTGVEMPEVIAQRMFAATTAGLLAYRVPDIDIPVLFLAAANTDPDATFARWRSATSELQVEVFAGDHFGENGITAAGNVAPVADTIDRYLSTLIQTP